MALNSSIHFHDNQLFVDNVAVQDIIEAHETPIYIYSLKRALENYQRIQTAFGDAEVHYSAKANGNLRILKTLINAGAGVDAVSAGEIYRALQAGCDASHIVFAGVGKSPKEIRFALEQGVGWFNVENVGELGHINRIAQELGRDDVKIALRLNPEVTANTHPYIATGHGGAKFGLTSDTIREVLNKQADYQQLDFAGLHVHIGSQLGDTSATIDAIERAMELITPYEHIKTLNIGGGFPAPYEPDADLPSPQEFADAVLELSKGYNLILEPGRSIIADAGIFVSEILYVKRQAGQTMYIVDGSMTELMRPALYQAKHHVVPVMQTNEVEQEIQMVGPVCETTDVLAKNITLPEQAEGNLLAMLTAGAYGMVMASNYNARVRPTEIVVSEDGQSWDVARRRESWDDLLANER